MSKARQMVDEARIVAAMAQDLENLEDLNEGAAERVLNALLALYVQDETEDYVVHEGEDIRHSATCTCEEPIYAPVRGMQDCWSCNGCGKRVLS